MKKLFKRILIAFGIAIIAFITLFAGLIILNTVNNYKPEATLLEHVFPQKAIKTADKKVYSVLSWNIGYAGLGADADFFYDGGRMARPEKTEYQKYWSGIQQLISTYDSLDFILLQEVDISAKRSYRINQFYRICDLLPNHTAAFAKNYAVSYVPVPLFNPLGKVESGLAMFSQYQPESTALEVFPLNYAWPKSLFMPDRCFMHSIIPISSGKKLHIINTHNSAFDDGSLRNAQLNILFDHMKTLYGAGDYVVVGGDWNVNPPGYENHLFLSGDMAFMLDFSSPIFEENPDWLIYFDPQFPTNRDVSAAYQKGHSPTTIMDFYVCSPNISVLEIKTQYDEFRNADHQGVYFRFTLD